MTTADLAAALRNCATGLLSLEAGVALLIANGTFLHRDDFTTRFISHGTSEAISVAAIDWAAAITALHAGQLPCSGGERRILQLSASLAAGIPVDLRDTVTSLDGANTVRLLTAIRCATEAVLMPTRGYHVPMTARTRSSIIGAHFGIALGLVDGATGQQDLGVGCEGLVPVLKFDRMRSIHCKLGLDPEFAATTNPD